MTGSFSSKPAVSPPVIPEPERPPEARAASRPDAVGQSTNDLPTASALAECAEDTVASDLMRRL